MRKLFFIAILFSATGFLFGQSLQKGNLVGVHVAELRLKPGVTEEQAVAFMLEKMIPAWEKNYDTKEYLMRSIKGKDIGKFAILTVFKDENHRDKYYSNSPEARGELKKIDLAMKDVNSESDKFWYPIDATYNDYLILAGKGWEIKKGSIININNDAVQLNLGFTNQQFVDYFIDNIIPAANSYYPDLGISASRIIRGDDSTKAGFIYYFADENVRSKLFDKDGNQTQFLIDYWTKYKDIYEGWGKIGTIDGSFNDWVVL
ncbi:MAG TPA: hypothetical protein VK179_20010 [Bacteroidales bacterium]|nr:hypothetical protein [Bacteroidales bacterium]